MSDDPILFLAITLVHGKENAACMQDKLNHKSTKLSLPKHCINAVHASFLIEPSKFKDSQWFLQSLVLDQRKKSSSQIKRVICPLGFTALGPCHTLHLKCDEPINHVLTGNPATH